MRKLILTLVVAVCSFPLAAQLSGTYTIDAGSPASATNYQSVNAAIGDLSTGTRSDGGPVNGPGVTGPVVLRLEANSGPYVEQVTIPAITGASATNTIRLTGGPGREEITYSGTTTTDRQVIKINGARHIILDSLTISNTDLAIGFGVHITNSADSNRVSNCVVSVYNASTSTNFAGIVIGGTTVTTNSDAGDGNVIENNTVEGGYYGITMRGLSTTVFNQRNKVINNTISDTYFYGVYCIYQNLAEIVGNTISGRASQTASSYGIFISTSDLFTCESNRIFNVGLYGIFITTGNNQGGTGTVRVRVVNNMIGGGWLSANPYGIYVAGTSRLIDIWHNSVSLTSGNGRALYILGTSSGIDVSNNSFAVFNSTTGYAAYINTAAMVNTVNYNNYWAPGSSNFVFIGSAYTTATYVGGGGFNNNSRHGDPLYVNNFTDLHATGGQLYDAGNNVGVTVDFDGDARPMAPTAIVDIGADEYMVANNDAGITALNSPVQPFPPGVQNVNVTLRNFGATTLTSAAINWSVNAVNQTPFAWTGSLATQASLPNINIGTFNFLAGNTYNVKVWTSNPNGVADQLNTNDTLEVQVCVALNGVYTVGGVGADYATVNDAVAALVCGGVSGAVTMRLNAGAGPFNEQVIIPAIPGASASRTVRFTGGAGRETITFGATTTTERAVIKLIGAKHIVLDSLTIINTGTSFGYGVQLTAAADSNAITNSIVQVSNTSTSSNFVGITLSAATVTTNADNGDGNLIANNEVIGGYYGITMRGFSSTNFNSGNKILNNDISEVHYYGIYCYQQNAPEIVGNTISHRATASTAAYGMYLYYADLPVVTNNSINNAGTYGIYFAYGNYQGGTGTARALIANNMIGGNWRATTPYGIYVTTSSRNLNIWHNSVSMNSGNGRALYILSGSGHDVRNNSFANFNSTTGYAAYVSSTGYLLAMDYNNYYAPGSSNFVFVGVAYTPATYIGGGGFNLNSRDGDPFYIDNANDLHSFAAQLYDAGTNLGVTTDFDGDVRPMAPTALYDIGADEFLARTNDAAVVELISPNNYDCADSNAVVAIRIRNLGSNTISNLPITVNVTGYTTATLNFTYTGSLAFNQVDTVIVGTVNTYPGAGTLTFSTSVALPGDQFAGNNTLIDTAYITPIAPLAVVTNDTLCFNDQAVIGVTPDGFAHKWYTTATGGNPIASGDTLTTTPLTATTTYYVESLSAGTGSLTTSYAGGNGCDGVMFNFIPNMDMRLDSFAMNIGSTITENVRMYYRVGGYAGFETNQGAWTLHGQIQVTGQGAGQPTMLPFNPLQVLSGQTYGIYFVLQSSNVDYTNGSLSYSNSDATINTGAGTCALFASVNAGRMFNGDVYYTKELCPNPVRVPVDAVVLPRPQVNLGNDTTVCGSIVLDAGNVGSTYAWSTSQTSQTITALGSGTYYVLVDDGACTNTDTINLVVNPNPQVLAYAYAPTICGGETDTLYAVGTASSYIWSSGGTDSIEVVNPTTTTTYTVVGINGNGCVDSTTVTITVLPAPVVGTSVNPSTVCLGDSITLNGTGAQSYVWSGGVTDGVPFLPTSSGTYTVTGTGSNNCSDTASITITINPLPVVTATASADTVCENASVTLNGTGATTYVWSGGVSDGVPFNATASSTYYVTGTDAIGCSATDSIAIVVNAAPVLSINASSTAVCDGSQVTLTASGAATYVWTGGVTNGVPFTPTATSTYTVTGTDAAGCDGTDAITITVNTLPTVLLNLPFTTICFDDASAALSGGQPTGGTWSGNGVSGATFDPSVAGNGAQSITYTYTDANGCVGSNSQIVTVDACVGVNEISGNGAFNVYPNPAGAFFFITTPTDASQVTVEVYDSNGKLVSALYKDQFNAHDRMEVNMNEAANGIYLVRVTTASGVNTSRVIINK